MAPPVFKTGLAGIAFAGGFDSLPPPPRCQRGKSGVRDRNSVVEALRVVPIRVAQRWGTYCRGPVLRQATYDIGSRM